MARSAAPKGTKTAAQLKHAIDTGRTGDKIDWPDPAAVPLGVDEEAAGTPLPSAAVERAHREETNRTATSQRTSARTGMMSLIAVLALVAAVLLWLLGAR